MKPDRVSSLMERALAYLLPVSPPLALLAALALFARRRPAIRLLLSDRWTVVCAAALGLLGAISGILAPSQRLAVQGPLGLALLFLAWTIGRFLVQDPRRFWIDLQRGIALVAVVVLAWVISPFTLEISIGPVTVPVARPHDPVAVFGLGANGLGLLLAFGTVLALGRVSRPWPMWERWEGGLLAGITLVAALLIGVRSALVGAAAGALVLALAAGPVFVVPILLTAAFMFVVKPDIWTSLRAANTAAEKPRLVAWLSALEMIRRHPFFGVGPFHFNAVKPQYLPPLAGGVDIEQLGPHNIYLRIASEWGIPAAILLFSWILSWPLRLWARRSETWRWSCAAGLCAYLVMGFFHDPLFTLHVSAPVFLGIGLAGAAVESSPYTA